MNLIIIIRKRKKKKEIIEKKHTDLRKEDAEMIVAFVLLLSPISILSFFFWRESPDSVPSYDLSFFSQEDAGFLFSIFHPNRDIKTTSFYTLHHKAKISEYLNSL